MKKILFIAALALTTGAIYYYQTSTEKLPAEETQKIDKKELKKIQKPKKILIKKALKSTQIPTIKTIKKDNIQHISIGASTVDIKLPTVPTPIHIVNNNVQGERAITFSKRTPPNYVPHSFEKKLKEKKLAEKKLLEAHKDSNKSIKISTIGEVKNGEISTYLRGTYHTLKECKDKLKSAGFDIVETTTLSKDKTLTTILFTNSTLMTLAKKENKGFIASLRLLVDEKEKTISITNPLYLAKSYLKKDYEVKDIQKILNTIRIAFPALKNSNDSLKYQLLSKYHFMMGMPYYDDMIEVASGKNLLNKIKKKNKIIATQKISNSATLIHIKLSDKTSQFIDKIGHKNASLLPYSILIENNVAKILDPKYYIALMYPKLSMSEFMSISDIPDTIIAESEALFK